MITKLNETYSLVQTNEPQKLIDFLKVLKPDAYFNKMIKLGFESPYRYFAIQQGSNVLIFNGHRYLLKSFGIEAIDESNSITENEVQDFLKTLELPFEPYDYQIKTVKLCLMNNKVLIRSVTSSGKSLSISIILEFFRRKGLKGVLVVPNINLLTQFKSDIDSYNLKELSDNVQLLGNGNSSDFSKTVTISTWQSLVECNVKDLNLDFIICDEVHRETGDTVSSIMINSINTKIKLGFTGTLPEDPVAKMMLLGLFGEPQTIITAKELIERGLATPVKIKSVFLNYSKEECAFFRGIRDYPKQFQFIKEHQKRSEVLYKIVLGMRDKGKNTLVLYQHTEHGKTIFTEIIQKLFPEIQVENKDITGRKSLEFQKQYNVFFMNGEQSGDIREKQRNLLETVEGTILIANYAICSTGVNMKNLHCLVLASPLKAFTTVSQSLGRLMRKHKSKEEAVVFDLIDNLGKSCIFMKQYKHRLQSSYIPEEFNVENCNVNL